MELTIKDLLDAGLIIHEFDEVIIDVTIKGRESFEIYQKFTRIALIAMNSKFQWATGTTGLHTIWVNGLRHFIKLKMPVGWDEYTPLLNKTQYLKWVLKK